MEDGEYEGRDMFQQPERQNKSSPVLPLPYFCSSMEQLPPTYFGMCALDGQYNYSQITQFCTYNVEDGVRKTATVSKYLEMCSEVPRQTVCFLKMYFEGYNEHKKWLDDARFVLDLFIALDLFSQHLLKHHTMAPGLQQQLQADRGSYIQDLNEFRHRNFKFQVAEITPLIQVEGQLHSNDDDGGVLTALFQETFLMSMTFLMSITKVRNRDKCFMQIAPQKGT